MLRTLRAARFASLVALCAGPLHAAPAEAPRCASPEHRQFAFWLGDWDGYDAEDDAVPSARVRVDAILGGCVLHERYEGTNGLVGESFSVYDTPRKLWHQSWVTNRGDLLVIEGRFQDGRMTLEGTTAGSDGTPTSVRGVWRPEHGLVREWAERSADGGKTWTKWFELVFREHKP